MRRYISLVVVALPILVSGCVAPAKYTWGNYDKSLYSYYKDPTKSQEHMSEIQTIIQTAEKVQGKVAPGIHAEYGYFLLQEGKSEEAVTQFKKEKEKWPESIQFMDTMIKIATSSKTSKPMASKE